MGNSTKKESSQSMVSVSIIDIANYVNAEIYNDFEDIDIGMKCLHYNIDFTEMYKLRSESKDLPGMFPEINYNEEEEEEEDAEDFLPESVMDSFYPDVQMQFVLEL